MQRFFVRKKSAHQMARQPEKELIEKISKDRKITQYSQTYSDCAYFSGMCFLYSLYVHPMFYRIFYHRMIWRGMGGRVF